jgi:hypothetical protein
MINESEERQRALSEQTKKLSPTEPLSRFQDLAPRIEQGEFKEVAKRLKPLIATTSHQALAEAANTIRRLFFDDTSILNIQPVDDLAFLLSCRQSLIALPGYATLHERHTLDIGRVTNEIYSYFTDATRTRPLNCLMLASPGSGKSHFIDCIAKKLSHLRLVATTFNMASMASVADFARPLDEVRNTKVDDKVPLLFLDEFDATPNNYSLLLPLLWDGALSIGPRHLKLGKVVIVLAGSSASLPSTLKQAKGMRSEVQLSADTTQKLIDLFSRINGPVVNIPSLGRGGEGTRPMDKVVIAVQLLKRRFGSDLKRVPFAFLRFIAKAQFRYDVRSITSLIDLIKSNVENNKIVIDESTLPALASVDDLRNSSLAYHLVDEEDAAHGIIQLWTECKTSTHFVPIVLPQEPPVGEPDENELQWFVANAIEMIKH